MAVYKTRNFSRWMRKTDLSENILCNAVDEMKRGLIDAELGAGLVKKRVPLPGRGKSGSVRTLVATNKAGRWIFLFGFQKNERDNISLPELEALKSYAHDLLHLTVPQLALLMNSGALQEICHEEKDQNQ